MDWIMFRQAGTYEYKGKKCDGFPSKTKDRIDLSWGGQIDWGKNGNNKTEILKDVKQKPKHKLSQPASHPAKQQLDKIVDSFSVKKKLENQQRKEELKTKEIIEISESKRKSNKTSRDEEQKIRYLESRLFPVERPSLMNRGDTMGSIINQQSPLLLNESRISQRSTSGNKKNESKFVFDDGMYNSFVEKPKIVKDYHDKLLQMFKYQDEKKIRNVSQIQM